jgi:hypothetical protein
MPPAGAQPFMVHGGSALPVTLYPVGASSGRLPDVKGLLLAVIPSGVKMRS